MPKRYLNQFVEDLNYTKIMHPSTWIFSWATKNINACFATTGIMVSALAFLNGFLGAPAGLTALFLMLLLWYFYTVSVMVRSVRILKKNYNEYLYPIEVAFNSMSYQDQKKYSRVLTEAYAICARRDYDEFVELEKIRELFELTAPSNSRLSIDSELEKKRKEVEAKRAHDLMIQEIADGLNRNTGMQ